MSHFLDSLLDTSFLTEIAVLNNSLHPAQWSRAGRCPGHQGLFGHQVHFFILLIIIWIFIHCCTMCTIS